MYKRVLFAATMLVAGTTAVFAQSSADAVRAWIAAVDQTSGWSARYGTLTEDTATGATVVTGLAIYSEREGGVRFDFDKVTVKGLAASPGSAFTAEEIGIDRVAISSTYYTGTMTDASLAGLVIPAVAGALTESDEPRVLVQRVHELVRDLRLDRGRIGTLAGKYNIAGESAETSYEDIEISGLANGRIENFTNGVSRSVAPSPEGPVVSVVQRAETRGSDFGTMLRLFDPYNPPEGDDGWQNVGTFAVYSGMAWAQGDTRVSIGEVSGENFMVRKPPASYAPAMRRLLEGETIPDSDAEVFAVNFALDILDSISIGRLSVRNVDASGPDVDRVRLGSFAIRDISLAGIGEIDVNDIAVAVRDQGDFSLERFALGGLVFPAAEVIRAAIRAERDGGPVQPASLIPQLGFIEFAGARLTLPGKPSGSLDRLRFEFRDYVSSIPTSAMADLRGLEVPVAIVTEAEAREVLDGLGLERIRVNYGYRIRWREADSRLLLDDLRLEIEDIGSLTVGVTIGGLRREMINVTYDAERLLQELTLEELRIVFNDRSVTDRALRYFAQKESTDVEALRQETADAIPFTLRLAIENDGLREKIAPALKAFLLKPGRLTLTARAKEPLPLGVLVMAAGMAPDSLSSLFEIDLVQE